MKKIIIASLSLLLTTSLLAQKNDEEKKHKFKVNNIFVGGTLVLGYSGGNGGSTFTVGLNPEVGYSIAEWLDVGINFNTIFSNSRYIDNFGNDITQKAFNYGAGTFARIHVFNGFFLQAQPEYNWIDYKAKLNNGTAPTQKVTVQASSFLVGAGYGRRVIGQSSFFTTVMFDLNQDKESPYRDGYGNNIPVIRTGFNFYLGQKKGRR
jgi:hypothetical protein